MLRKLFVFVVCLMAAVATASAQTPPYNEIWYTTTDGRPIDSSYYENNSYSNTYRNGKGVIRMWNDVTLINFRYCSNLETITIPNNKHICFVECAFAGCDNLKRINWSGCKDGRSIVVDGVLVSVAPAGLTHYTIPNGVKKIGVDVFSDYEELKSVTIPNGVTEIDDRAFMGCKGLTSVVMPKNATYIGYDAFNSCKNLTSITIPSGVTSINDGTFYECESLKSVTIADSVTEIRERAFDRCKSLTSITIPNGVEWIGRYAFYRCSSLTNLTIPDSVEGIGEGAFAGCSSLKSLTIPDSVEGIGENAFAGCSSLKSITLPNTVQLRNNVFGGCNMASITVHAISGEKFNYYNDKLVACTGEYASEDEYCIVDNGTLIQFIGRELTEYSIPNGVTSIGETAFRECSNLTSITIPNSVTSIGEKAFYGCISLTSITIPDSVTEIGSYAFWACTSLTSVTIPNSVTEIKHDTFSQCINLTNVTIPNSITTIGSFAFHYCSSLTSITIPDSVTMIESNAFKGCRSLESITISNSVTEVTKYGAFRDCSSLKDVNVHITDLGKYCTTNTMHYIPGKKHLYIDNIEITELVVPDSVKIIHENTFEGCSNLRTITLGSGITEIERSAFEGCDNLTTIICLASVPSTIYFEGWKDSYTLLPSTGINATMQIYVPKKSVKLYKKGSRWSRFAKQIKPIK